MTQLPFINRIQSGPVLIADGATGTNLLARGLPRGVSSEAWLFDRPEEILRLHSDFVAAGADILLTDTFGGSPMSLEGHGLTGKVVEVSRRAVELTRQAGATYVAGSIGPLGKLLKPFGPLEEDTALENFTAQAQALSEAGADLLVIETQFDLKEAGLALKAARSVCSLPVVVSFSYDRGTRTMMGVKPAQMAAEFEAAGADLLGVNCGRSLEENLQALGELRAATRLPLWFKPNAGLPAVDDGGNTVYKITPEEMGAAVARGVAAGAAVVGGCCGTSPAHLRAIATQARA